MTGLADLPLQITAGIGQKNLPHHGLGKFLKLRGVAGLADLVAHVGRFLRRLSLSGPKGGAQEKKERPNEGGGNQLFHIIPPLLLIHETAI